MTRRVIVRKFDPIRPVYAAKKFTANGKQYEIGEELAWRALEVSKRRVKLMYDSGLLVHGDEKPRHEMVRERNMDSSKAKTDNLGLPESFVDEAIEATKQMDRGETKPYHIGKDPDTIGKSEYPRHAGGPWYELSNGERVKGKKNAQEAEAKL